MEDYSIINSIDIENIRFSETNQTRSTIRYSNDGNYFIISYFTEPSFFIEGLVIPYIKGKDDAIKELYSENWQ